MEKPSEKGHDRLIAGFLPKIAKEANDRGVVCGSVRLHKSYIPKKVARGIEMSYVFPKTRPSRIEMWIYHRDYEGGTEASKDLFEHFVSKMREIEQAYGGPLTWDYGGRRTAFSIQQEYPDLRLSDEAKWGYWIERLVTDMKKLDDALVPHYINTRI